MTTYLVLLMNIKLYIIIMSSTLKIIECVKEGINIKNY